MESLAEFKQGEDEGIKSVHDHVLYMIMSYLELRDASALILSNRSFYQTLRKSKEGQIHLKIILWRELGLTNISGTYLEYEAGKQNNLLERQTIATSYYSDLEKCLLVYEKKVKHLKSETHRFFGFKSSHGVDQNQREYSVSNVFVPHRDLVYCSQQGPNVNLTGVLIPENPRELDSLNEEARRLFTPGSLLKIKSATHTEKYESLFELYNKLERTNRHYPDYLSNYQ